jgi:protein-tyrosine phosphatase
MVATVPRVPEPFRILVVCTGNICRSPMAEAMLRHRLAERLGADATALFEVGSAGTYGIVAAPMEPFALEALAAYGVDPGDFASRELVTDLVTGADLVLGATREHRAAVARLAPRAQRRNFTLREFARLATAVDPTAVDAAAAAAAVADGCSPVAARARAAVEAVAAKRGFVPPATPADDDVPDPYRRDRSAFDAAAALLAESTAAVVDALLGPGCATPR